MIGVLKANIQNIDKDFFTVHNVNQLVKNNIANCIFCDQVDKNFILPIETNILQRVNSFNFNGIIITDDLMRSQDLVHNTYSKKRFLYLYHLDWPYINNLQFIHIKRILLNDNIELIARSESHSKLIENLFKKPKYIMAEWDYKTLIEIDQNE